MTLDRIEARLRGLLAERERCLVVLAGSNGAGKSTFYDIYLGRLGLPFVNADLIAATLPINDPQRLAREASELADAERHFLMERGESFCTETVFSDPVGAKLELLREAQSLGYVVVLVFIGIASPELSELRVSQRTAAGGHGVPRARLVSRFPRTLANLRAAVEFVDVATLLDNSSLDEPYRAVARWESGHCVWRSALQPVWLPKALR